MKTYDAKQELSTAVIGLAARGPVSTRLLYGHNAVWEAKTRFGRAVVDAWLRELVQPEQEPPDADTWWWLR